MFTETEQRGCGGAKVPGQVFCNVPLLLLRLSAWLRDHQSEEKPWTFGKGTEGEEIMYAGPWTGGTVP